MVSPTLQRTPERRTNYRSLPALDLNYKQISTWMRGAPFDCTKPSTFQEMAAFVVPKTCTMDFPEETQRRTDNLKQQSETTQLTVEIRNCCLMCPSYCRQLNISRTVSNETKSTFTKSNKKPVETERISFQLPELLGQVLLLRALFYIFV